MQEYLELSNEEFEHIKTLFNKKATYYKTLMDCYKDDRGLSRRTDPVKSGRFLMKVSIHSISNDKKV